MAWIASTFKTNYFARPLMSFTSRWGLGTRLGAGFLLVSGIFVAAAFPLLWDLDVIETGMERVIEQRIESSETAGALLSDINRSMAAMRGWMLTNDKIFITQHHNVWNDIGRKSKKMEQIARLWKETEDYNKWSRIRAQLSEFGLVLATIENMDTATRGNKAIAFLRTGAEPKAEDLLTALGGAVGPNGERSGGLIGNLRSRAISDENEIHEVIYSHAWLEWAFLISGMHIICNSS